MLRMLILTFSNVALYRVPIWQTIFNWHVMALYFCIALFLSLFLIFIFILERTK